VIFALLQVLWFACFFVFASAFAFCERSFSTLAFSGRIFGALISFSFFDYFSIAACLRVLSTLIVQLPHPIL
jgi:hypothetical protein